MSDERPTILGPDRTMMTADQFHQAMADKLGLSLDDIMTLAEKHHPHRLVRLSPEVARHALQSARADVTAPPTTDKSMELT